MKKKKPKKLISILIFCMVIYHSTSIINPQNHHQIKSSDEDDKIVTMEEINGTLLKFRIESSRDVTAFRMSYVVNHTNGSSFYNELGGMGDIFGIDIMPTGLQFWNVYKDNLYLYQNGGNMYNFFMIVYFINPLDSGTYHAGRITPEPYPPDDDNSTIIEEGGGEDDGDPDELDENLNWLWAIPISVTIVIIVVYRLFHPKKKVAESSMNERKINGKEIDEKTHKGLEQVKKKRKAVKKKK